MRLADQILAARGTMFDIGGFATRMSRFIQEAQRFEIADDVARAAGQLVYSRPSTLAAALPLCRLPYDTTWIECRGGLGRVSKREDNAPIPARQGMLIESPPIPGMRGQVGFMTEAWVHAHYDNLPAAVNFTPVAIYFDWRPDGDVRDVIRTVHRLIIEQCQRGTTRELAALYIEGMEKRWLNISTPEAVSHFFTGFDAWKGFANDPKEVEAIRRMDHHMMAGVSPHGVDFVGWVLSKASRAEIRSLMSAWEADIQGEGTWVECFLAMLNSRNPVVEHEPVDMTKLNRARRRSGKPEFLTYSTTRLTLSRSQGRIADAHGITREAARAHLVRGHFKIRRTGVYWWSPFLRGVAKDGEVERQAYEVA
jgi:hypothetical protein